MNLPERGRNCTRDHAEHDDIMVLKSWIKQQAGMAAATCCPRLARAVAAGDAAALAGRLGRLILHAQTQRAAQRGAWADLRRSLAGYWRSAEGDRFYDAYPQRFEEWFLKAHYPVVETVCRLAGPESFRFLYEIGCGDGRVLNHMAGRLPALKRLTGLDLNPGIIARNRITFAGNTRLAFESVDAQAWLIQHARPGSILMTYGGVLEYFTEADLRTLFAHFGTKLAPALVALVEPLADDFDLQAETSSRPHGAEHSFSHPYLRLLEAAGFEIILAEEVRLEHRWLMLVARTRPG
jgi:SAM-dependent methyltransferase